MNKLLAIALVTLAASVATVGSASAFAFSDEMMDKINSFKKSRTITSPGDAFYANVDTPDVREECDAAGGELKRKFIGNDFQWVCVL